MKFKKLWEFDDIKTGNYIIRESVKEVNKKTIFQAMLVSYMITYYFDSHDKKKNIFCLTSVSDGYTRFFNEKTDLLKFLNGDFCGYRPLIGKSLFEVLKTSIKEKNSLW